MRYKLQPQERSDMTLPYPYFIGEDKLVGRQDFWKGKPYKLLGFNDTPSNDMSIVLMGKKKVTLEDLQQGIGKFPVFADKKNNWFTYGDPIESVKELEDVKAV